MKIIESVFLIMILIYPFCQGGYFLHTTYGLGVILLVLLGAVIYIRKEIRVQRSVVLLLLVLMTVNALMSVIGSIDSGMAVFGGLKYCVYVLFYVLLLQFDEDIRKRGVEMLIYNMFAMSLLGIVAAFIPDLFEEVYRDNRFGGMVQYANTYGILALGAIILILKEKKERIIDYVMVTTLFMSIILTFSRSILILTLLSLVICMVIERRVRFKVLLSTVFGQAIAQGIILLLQLNETSERLKEMTLNASEWRIREIYYMDALNIVRDFPLGVGYLSYPIIQRTYRSGALYYVKFVHNHLLQAMLDFGIVGGILLLLLFYFILRERSMNIYYKLIVGIMVLHGMIDFDFQFTIVYLWMILLIIGNNNIRAIKVNNIMKIWMPLVIVTGVYVSLCIGTYQYYQKDYVKAYNTLPFYTHAKLSAIKSGKLSEDEKAEICYELIEDNDYLPSCYDYLQEYYYEKGELTLAHRYSLLLITYDPINMKGLEDYCKIQLALSEIALQGGNRQEAMGYLNKVINIECYLQELAKNKNTHYNVKHKVSFDMTDLLTDYVNKAIELNNEALGG